MKALVTGATGFIGRRLVGQLDEVVVLSRDAERARQTLAGGDVHVYAWDPQAGSPPPQAFDGVKAVFHLAGESVAEGRWTAAKKQRIRDSRVVGTRNLVAAIRDLATRPKVLVSASAVGFYGDRNDETLTEQAGPGDDFLAQVSVAWEQEARQADALGLRVVNPRIGIVLGADGGAAPKMARLFRLGLGSPLGSGRQWMPWIHLDDLVQLLLFVAGREGLQGPCNAVAPEPTTNRDFTKALARVLHRPAVLPSVPGFALRTALGEFAGALLASQKVSPQVALAEGFEFRHPGIDEALRDVFGK
jgi:uncharacterized protein (TIGR01777 family)